MQKSKKTSVPVLEQLEGRLTPSANPAVVQVENLYEMALRREPDIGGWTHFVEKVDSGAGLAQVGDALFRSGEFANAAVGGMYQALLRREPDAWGLNGFTRALQGGESLERVTAAMLGSPERSGGLSDSQFVSEMYYVILNRPADAAGAQAFTGALRSGASRADVALAMLESPEASRRVAANLYQSVLGRTPSSAEAGEWAGRLAGGGLGVLEAVSAFAGSGEGAARLATPGAASTAPPEFWWDGFVGISTDAARREVQRISGEMSEVMRQRRVALDAGQPVGPFDAQLDELDAARNQALTRVVLAENPQTQEVDRANRLFSLPVPGAPSGDLTGYASPLVAWNAENLPSVNGQFQALVRGPGPDSSKIWSNQSLGGSTNFSSFYRFPGDFDFPEQWVVTTAQDADTAATWITQGILDFAAHMDQAKLPNLEVLYLSVNKTPWTLARLLEARTDQALFDTLKDSIRNINGGNLYFSFYGLLDDGRISHMQKVISINARGPEDEDLFSSNPNWAWFLEDGAWDESDSDTFFKSRGVASYFQEVYVVNGASTLDPISLGVYAEIMHGEVLKEVDVKHHYLKASNRAFSYLRTIGDIEGMEKLKPVFSSTYLAMNQRNAMLDAITLTLSGNCSSRLLTASKARAMLYLAARDLESLSGGVHSADLRDLADRLRGTGTTMDSPLAGDTAQNEELANLYEQISDELSAGVAPMVIPVVEEHVRPY